MGGVTETKFAAETEGKAISDCPTWGSISYILRGQNRTPDPLRAVVSLSVVPGTEPR